MAAIRLFPTMLSVLFFYLFISATAWSQDATSDYAKLAKELEVRELNTLMFAKYNDANLKKLDAFLKKYPKAPEREKVLYLRAHTIWSLHRYDEAPPAYAALLREFPDGRFKQLGRIREAAAYLFSGRAEKALPKLKSLQDDYPGRPEIYARELAYSLARCGKQAEALTFMDDVETFLSTGDKSRLLPRIKNHFDVIRMIDKPLRAFEVKDHQTGKKISSETLKGNVVMIDFWATWCRPCIAELPFLLSAHREFSSKGFAVFSISLDDDKDQFERMIAERKMNWRHYYDGKKWSNDLALVFEIHSVPANLLVDRKGIVRSVNLRGVEINSEVAKLLRE